MRSALLLVCGWLVAACPGSASEPSLDGEPSEARLPDLSVDPPDGSTPAVDARRDGRRDGSIAGPCTTDPQCTAPGAPFCVSGACVACRTDPDCKDPQKKCTQGTCVAAPACGDGAKPTSYTWPVPSVHTICQGFKNPITYQTCKWHTGIDVCGSIGLTMVAIAPGRVVHVGYMWYNGATTGRGPYAIVLQHAPNFYSTYSHNNKALVKVGDCVTAGQKIAEMGSLGYSGGPHLHFEMIDGTAFTGNWSTPFNNACSYYVNPLSYIKP
jgi:murein DD-endopeptidase MepM/ murein hydrolase activator NlpD